MSVTYETTKKSELTSVEHVDTVEDKRLLRKVDLRYESFATFAARKFCR